MDDCGVTQLGELVAHHEESGQSWSNSARVDLVETLSALAASLREESVREQLQGTNIPEHLVTIFSTQHGGLDSELAEQVGRVAANYGAENAVNLDALLAAGYPQQVLDVLSNELAFPASRALIASLLNAVMSDHQATKAELSEPGNLKLLLALPGRFTKFEGTIGEQAEARASVAEWIWTIIEVLTIHSPDSLSESISPSNIASFLDPINAFMPPHRELGEVSWDSLLEILQHYCECLERLSELETSPEIRHLPHVATFTSTSVIETILDFAENGAVPPGLDTSSDFGGGANAVPAEVGEEEEPPRGETFNKVLGGAKGSVLKFVTSLCWETPYDRASPLWTRIGNWLDSTKYPDRDDLISSALICFANGVKNADVAIQLLEGDASLLPVVSPLLSPQTKVTIQHSVIGLVRNLANPPENKVILGEAGVVDRLIDMEVFSDKRDMVGTVQGGSAGLIKLLCQSNPRNSSEFVRHPKALDEVLALIKRTDDPNIGYEATRIFVNATKSLSGENSKYSDEFARLSQRDIISSIVDLLRRTARWPLLINDSIISLTLLATFGPEGTVMDELELEHVEKEEEAKSGVDVIRSLAHPSPGKVSEEIKANTGTLMSQLKERTNGRLLEA